MKFKSAIALALVSIPMLSGCGSNGGSSNTAASGSYGALTCSGNVCYPTNGSCIPINQPITFSGNGLSLDATNDIVGGVIPNTSSSVGTVVTATTQSLGGAMFTDNETSGLLQMQVQSASPGTDIPTTAAISGQVQLSQIIQTDMMEYYPTGVPGSNYSTSTYGYSTSSLCVSGMAIQGHLYTTGGYGFGGQIYLYLNNTSHGYILYFY